MSSLANLVTRFWQMTESRAQPLWVLVTSCRMAVRKPWGLKKPVTQKTFKKRGGKNQKIRCLEGSAADVKMEMPVLMRSLKSNIISSTSFKMNNTFRGVGSAAVEQSRRKANMVVQGGGKFGPRG